MLHLPIFSTQSRFLFSLLILCEIELHRLHSTLILHIFLIFLDFLEGRKYWNLKCCISGPLIVQYLPPRVSCGSSNTVSSYLRES